MKRVYLDHAATTPIDSRVAKAMHDFEMRYFGNPNSIHREGQEARAKIDTARAKIAKFINSKPQEIIFTSGATESNNLAIQGVVNYAIEMNKRGKSAGGGPAFGGKPHVITTMLEHQSVYNTVKNLEKRGLIEATFVNPIKDGLIDPQAIVKAIKRNTVLVSIIFVSNEIGSVLPVRETGALISAYAKASTYVKTSADKSADRRAGKRIIYHIDAVQATKFFNCSVDKLGCDLMTISAHKIYGPKGIGALYVKKGVKLNNLSYGGSQEYGKRPGTQNSTGIIGMAKAIELLGTLETRQRNAKRITILRELLIQGLNQIPQTEINGPIGDLRAPDNVNFLIYGVDQDSLIAALDLIGISASTGSACVSGSNEPSQVILSLGKLGFDQGAIVRFTLSRDTSRADIEYVIKNVKQIVLKLRNR